MAVLSELSYQHVCPFAGWCFEHKLVSEDCKFVTLGLLFFLLSFLSEAGLYGGPARRHCPLHKLPSVCYRYIFLWMDGVLCCPGAGAGVWCVLRVLYCLFIVYSMAVSFCCLLGLYVLQLTGTPCNSSSARHTSVVIA